MYPALDAVSAHTGALSTHSGYPEYSQAGAHTMQRALKQRRSVCLVRRSRPRGFATTRKGMHAVKVVETASTERKLAEYDSARTARAHAQPRGRRRLCARARAGLRLHKHVRAC